MILFQKTLKTFCTLAYKPSSCKSFLELLRGSQFRLLATEETAVQKVTLKFKKKPYGKTSYTFGSWVLLVIPVASFGLGTWQVFRLFEKEKLNEEFMKKISQDAVDFPKNLEELEDMEFRKVRVKGKFDHSREIYFGPRTKIDDAAHSKPSSLLSISNAGFFVITPFKLSDRDLTIMVNRGWVPAKQKHPATREEGQITDEVEFVGLVRLNEKRQPLGVKNIPEKGFWVFRDLSKMAEVTGAAPIMIDADVDSTVPGGPCGGQTVVGLPNQHLSYIYTWYGLSAASGYLWYLRHLQKLPIIV